MIKESCQSHECESPHFFKSESIPLFSKIDTLAENIKDVKDFSKNTVLQKMERKREVKERVAIIFIEMCKIFCYCASITECRL